jgi:hypothetical protein
VAVDLAGAFYYFDANPAHNLRWKLRQPAGVELWVGDSAYEAMAWSPIRGKGHPLGGFSLLFICLKGARKSFRELCIVKAPPDVIASGFIATTAPTHRFDVMPNVKVVHNI